MSKSIDYGRELLNHLIIELYLNGNFRLIEHISKSDRNVLLENYGLSNNVVSLSKYLSSLIIKNKDFFKKGGVKIFKVETNWVCSVWITSVENQGYVAAYTSNGDYDEIIQQGRTMKIDNLKLRIDKTLLEKPQFLYVKLCHELTHAYEDFHRRIKNKENSIANNSRDEKFFINVEGWNNVIQKILYLTREHEMRAYIADMVAEITENGKQYTSINEVLNDFKKTDSFQMYNTVNNWFNNLCDVKDKSSQDILLQNANFISGRNFSNWNNFIKYIRNRQTYFNKKVNQLLPKIITRCLKVESIVTWQTDKPLEFKGKSLRLLP